MAGVWTSPGIRYFSAMSLTCLPTSAAHPRHAPLASRRRWRPRAAPRNASSGNLESITMQRLAAGNADDAIGPVAVGERELEIVKRGRQAVARRSLPSAPGRRRRAPACWTGSAAATRPGPDRAEMFFCASSITVSRAWMPPIVSAVLVALSVRFSPSRLSSASSRSARVRVSCACAATRLAGTGRRCRPGSASSVSSRGSGRAVPRRGFGTGEGEDQRRRHHRNRQNNQRQFHDP